MAKAELMTNVTRAFHKFGFQLKKHSPEILVTTGVIGTVASAVLACRATLKVHEVVAETKETLDIIHESAERGLTPNGATYTEEDSKKDITLAYVQTGLKYVKLYAPAVILGTLSLGCIVKSNDILRKRNGALVAAYAAIDKGFKEYRGRVVDRFGKEVDRELRYNIKSKEIEETVVDEKGKEKTVKKTVKTIDASNLEDYQFLFYELSSSEWVDNADFNLMFLKARQAYLNDQLYTRGYVFLNEVLKELGLAETKMGQVVGWVYDKNDPDNDASDNYIDFGFLDYTNERCRAFIDGYENAILLDFNCDGPILDRAF